MQNLKSGDFKLMISGQKVLKSFFKDEHKIYTLIPYVHLGTFQDSILLTELGVADLRLFPKGFNSFEFYSISDNIERIIISNSGDDVEFVLEWGSVRYSVSDAHDLILEKNQFINEGKLPIDIMF